MGLFINGLEKFLTPYINIEKQAHCNLQALKSASKLLLINTYHNIVSQVCVFIIQLYQNFIEDRYIVDLQRIWLYLGVLLVNPQPKIHI